MWEEQQDDSKGVKRPAPSAEPNVGRKRVALATAVDAVLGLGPKRKSTSTGPSPATAAAETAPTSSTSAAPIPPAPEGAGTPVLPVTFGSQPPQQSASSPTDKKQTSTTPVQGPSDSISAELLKQWGS